MERTYAHIDLDERRKIARWRAANLSVDIIAEKLGRHRSTIFRELKRNRSVDDQITDLTGYYCTAADQKARERRSKRRKLIRFDHLRQSVIKHISDGWSPQQIAGRMQLERHPISVSHETIYQFVYSDDGRKEGLWKYLPERRAQTDIAVNKLEPKKSRFGKNSQRDLAYELKRIHLDFPCIEGYVYPVGISQTGGTHDQFNGVHQQSQSSSAFAQSCGFPRGGASGGDSEGWP